ncbi:Hypothetical protein SCLAV_1583 [Streptomyces clavuligerus]|uniref:Uncharacterized protein n=1 Tax=Streptomyces clavuligerus TaxID=1901 RepID=B5GQQ8_STRCL|nr:hypothetical protein SSCG_01682 [Streptomyces clavuligerus]EFG06658.1 Hypothetical protein SCLAV_1583 [Streptomyces clavuligerus]
MTENPGSELRQGWPERRPLLALGALDQSGCGCTFYGPEHSSLTIRSHHRSSVM